MGRCDIWLVLLLIGWAGVDMSVCLPSLWVYIRSLGGSKAVYGLAGAVASGAQFVSSPIFGMLADRHSDRAVIAASLLVQMCGGLLYACAVAFPHPGTVVGGGGGSSSGSSQGSVVWTDESTGSVSAPPPPHAAAPTAAYVVVAARGLLGFAAGNGATCRAYLARNSNPSARTRNLGLAAAAWRVGLVLGPAINWMLVQLPTGQLHTPSGALQLQLSSLTWVGYFIALSSAVSLMLVLAVLRANAPPPTATTAGKLLAGEDQGGRGVWMQLWRSRAWVMQYHPCCPVVSIVHRQCGASDGASLTRDSWIGRWPPRYL
jgi:MFS family permease